MSKKEDPQYLFKETHGRGLEEGAGGKGGAFNLINKQLGGV